MQLLDSLISRGVLPEGDRLRAADAIASAPDLAPHVTLMEKGFVKENDLMPVLADEFGMEWVDLTQTKVDAEALSGAPLKLLNRKNLMPIARHNGTLTVATADPYDVYSLDELHTLTGLHIHPVLGSPREITRLIKTNFGMGGDTVSALVEERKDDVEFLEDFETDDSELAKQAQQASVVKLVNEFLVEAANERASDIHLEHEEGGIRVRYRVDGLLQEQKLPPAINQFAAAIVSRLKIMARLNIAEKRLPQDGRIKMRVQGREVDVRVSIIPMIHGEGMVMRLLDKSRMVFNLKNIGFASDIDRRFRQLLDLPHGIVIVTGPTGSGKSTTLYSALNEVKSETLKVITVEDPVEYQQPGISQIQTHAKIGLTFAAALRSILRHDPDVILIGEMRDLETAQSAIQASLTGHLVFSTLHTNDAPSAFTRMTDMGVEPFLVSTTVEGIMAQRLVRTICPDCKTEYEPSAEEVPIDFPWKPSEEVPVLRVHKGLGCRACRQSGYRGRTGIHELLITNDLIRDLISQRVTSAVIRAEGMKNGMRTLRQDGWIKALNGKTTIDEVGRTTAGDIS
ncbi:GspE/PulE family protein [Limnoglobus roseus]|uniref:General secretion pathway protein E n=1 Tax=Limnoglobus roseus TaxID=2598579 RepID=A0A5C1AJE5_9BACT|nr:ATPase, T2SS/T4P/T4SS family [Limnoglobus roseus]QEL18795.1 general secretion pathway protein E [Limnoglobus roseus]